MDEGADFKIRVSSLTAERLKEIDIPMVDQLSLRAVGFIAS